MSNHVFHLLVDTGQSVNKYQLAIDAFTDIPVKANHCLFGFFPNTTRFGRYEDKNTDGMYLHIESKCTHKAPALLYFAMQTENANKNIFEQKIHNHTSAAESYSR